MNTVMCQNNRFIILRGPSGSGKSTVARVLFDRSSERTALIQQDHYRFIFNPPGGGNKPNSDTIHRMIESNCIVALEDGYDVILEGILSVKSYNVLLERLIDRHKGHSYMFYFDVSLEETLKRHEMRSETSQFSVEDMYEWYRTSGRSNHQLEMIIPESFSIQESVEFIQKSILIKELQV
jgi:predicted kinase